MSSSINAEPCSRIVGLLELGGGLQRREDGVCCRVLVSCAKKSGRSHKLSTSLTVSLPATLEIRLTLLLGGDALLLSGEPTLTGSLSFASLLLVVRTLARRNGEAHSTLEKNRERYAYIIDCVAYLHLTVCLM